VIQTLNFSILKASIAEMSTWIHTYISSQDGLECVNSDVRVHSVFYAICQTLFYVIAFRHYDLVRTKKSK
jgi:RNA polymerase I-specific transcription initiation factor RRN3